MAHKGKGNSAQFYSSDGRGLPSSSDGHVLSSRLAEVSRGNALAKTGNPETETQCLTIVTASVVSMSTALLSGFCLTWMSAKPDIYKALFLCLVFIQTSLLHLSKRNKGR